MRKRVLVFDEERLVARAACRVLAAAGWEAAMALTWEEADQVLLAVGELDAILVSLDPVGHARALLQRAIELRPACRRVLTTSRTPPPPGVAHQVLTGPWNAAQLLEAVGDPGRGGAVEESAGAARCDEE